MAAGTRQSTLNTVFPRAMPGLCQRAQDYDSVLDSRSREYRVHTCTCSRVARIEMTGARANTGRVLRMTFDGDIAIDRLSDRSYRNYRDISTLQIVPRNITDINK